MHTHFTSFLFVVTYRQFNFDDGASSSSSSSSSTAMVRSNATVGHVDVDEENELMDINNNGYNGKYYCYTINNPTGDFKKVGDLLNNKLNIRYSVWSYEKGVTGTPHIQGYLQLVTKSKWAALKNKMRPLGAWCAPAKGTVAQNVDYIGHTGKHAGKAGLIQGPWTFGDAIVVAGQRTDLDGLVNSIKGGKTLVQCANDHTATMLKYFSSTQKMINLLNNKRRGWMTELYIYTGIAGSGKSYAAHEEAAKYLKDNNIDEEVYDLMVPNKGQPLWWEGYCGQSVVVIDDFYGTIDIDYFKRMIDRYSFKVNMKNSSAEFLAKRVYVTSNIGWRNWWSGDLLSNKNNEDAIVRRITVDKYFDKKYVAGDEYVPVTMLNDRAIGDVGEIGELACDENFNDIVNDDYDAFQSILNNHSNGDNNDFVESLFNSQ